MTRDYFRVVAAYADGGVINSNPSRIGGPWAYCHVNYDGKRIFTGSGVLLPGEHVPGAVVTNNQSEFYAALQALVWLPDGWSGQLCSDSNVTLGRLATIHTAEPAQLPAAWVDTARATLARLGPVELVLVSGHPTKRELAARVSKSGRPVSEHNVWCDRECTHVGALLKYNRLGVGG